MTKGETNEGLNQEDLNYLKWIRHPDHGMYYDLSVDKLWYYTAKNWGAIVYNNNKE